MSVLFTAVSLFCHVFTNGAQGNDFQILDKQYGFYFLELNEHEMHTDRFWQNSANT